MARHTGNGTRFQSSEEVASICACRSSGIDRKGENPVEEDIQVWRYGDLGGC